MTFVAKFHGPLLFHFAETQRQVAGHQPEDVRQVGVVFVSVCGFALVNYDPQAEEADIIYLFKSQVVSLGP